MKDAPQAAVHSNDLRLLQIQQLYRSTAPAMLASLAMSLFLGLSLYPTVERGLILWLAAQLLLTLIAVGISLLFQRHTSQLSPSQWEHLHLALTATSTISWSGAITWFFPAADSQTQMLMIFLISGLHMGAATSLSYRPLPYFLFVGTTSSLLGWQILRHPEFQSQVAIALFAVLLPITLITAGRHYRNNRKNLISQLQTHEQTLLLQRSEQRFRSIVDSVGDIFLVHTLDGIIIDNNRRACDLLSYSGDALLHKKISDIAGDAAEIYHHLLRTLSHNEPMIYEADYLCGDGSVLPVEACVSQYHDPGQGDVILVLARDLSLKHIAQQELNESRKKLDLHIHSTPLAVIEWDTHFVINSWNPAAEKIFGYAANEVIGRLGIELLLPPDFRKEATCALQTIIKEGRDNRGTIKNITHSGKEIYCDWINTPLVDRHGVVRGIASLAMDVTDRIEAEQALKAAMLSEQAANSAKSEFLSRMSHELRTPLNAIIGLSNLLQTDLRLEKDQQELVNDIRHAGDHLHMMVNDILDLSRIEQGKIKLNEQPESFHGLIQGALHLTESMIRQQQLELIYQPEGEDFYLLVDKQRVIQVLVNLIGNAVKYNRAGGFIKITAKTLDDGFIRISIFDNGIGIPKEQQHKIFEPFQRAGAEFSGIEGNGLGLMLSKQLMEKMAGSIGFESAPNQGSHFWITLPAKASALLNDTPRNRQSDES